MRESSTGERLPGTGIQLGTAMLGHSSRGTTEIYAEPASAALVRAKLGLG